MTDRFPESPCRDCGKYYRPIDFLWNLEDTTFYYQCLDHGPYQRSFNNMVKFRVRCSKAGTGNRKRLSTWEVKVAKQLLLMRIAYQPNKRVGPFLNGNGHRVYYWMDLFLPKYKIDLECSPSLWHGLWDRPRKDRARMMNLRKKGIRVVTLRDRQMRNQKTLRSYLKRRIPGTTKVNAPREAALESEYPRE